MSRMFHLVPGPQVLVLLLALTQGLPLSIQSLDQVSVLQTLQGELLRQNVQLPLVGSQLLPSGRQRRRLRRLSGQSKAFN